MPPLELKFDVWQFVRVMVHLEDNDPKSTLLKKWGDVWSELDKDLAKFAESDFAAYSDLMMNQNVVFEESSKEDLAETLKVLDGVIVQMKGASKQKGLDEEQKASLTFEIDELQSLRRGLKLLA